MRQQKAECGQSSRVSPILNVGCETEKPFRNGVCHFDHKNKKIGSPSTPSPNSSVIRAERAGQVAPGEVLEQRGWDRDS